MRRSFLWAWLIGTALVGFPTPSARAQDTGAPWHVARRPGTQAAPDGAAAAGTPVPSPSIPLDLLREGGVEGFSGSDAGAVHLLTARYGRIASGWAIPVEPGERVEFEIDAAARAPMADWLDDAPQDAALERVETVTWELPGGRLSLSTAGGYRLTAPTQPGNYRFRMTVARRVHRAGQQPGTERGQTVELMLLVKTPFDRTGNGVIKGYPIGIYPNEKGRNISDFVERNRELYQPPASFILATPDVEGLHVSEHYKLGDFVPAGDRGKPSYLALSPRLLEFLEAAIDELQPQWGRPGSPRPLVVLSAFLSPNQLMQLGAKGVKLTLFTRYQYGDGAAVMWDADGDGRMDDLNSDGRIDIDDARAFAERLAAVQKRLGKFGGIGAEAGPRLPFMADTPYVDVDMRGVASRW